MTERNSQPPFDRLADGIEEVTEAAEKATQAMQDLTSAVQAEANDEQ
ncbi:hypothetical protein [Streptomyces sp. NPDC053048]